MGTNFLHPFNFALRSLWFAVVAALVWAQFRGLDMLDGGYYFLAYADPADNLDTQTRFPLLARPVWLLCSENIVVFRLVCLALISIACVAFWLSWRKLLYVKTPEFQSLSLLCIWLAAIAGLTWVPVALTYNSLATIFMLFGLSAAQRALGATLDMGASGSQRTLMGFLVIAFAPLIFLSKPPTAALYLGIVVLLATISPSVPRLIRRILLFASILVMLAVGIWLLFFLRQSVATAKPIIVAGLFVRPDWIIATGHRYILEITQIAPLIGADHLWTLAPLILCSCFIIAAPAGNMRQKAIIGYGLILVLISITVAFLHGRLWDASFAEVVTGRVARFYILFWNALIVIVTALMCSRSDRRKMIEALRGRRQWIAIFLFVPLLSSFGSTNAAYVSALHETVFWASGLVLMADAIAIVTELKWFRSAVAGILCLAAISHIYSGEFLRPYMYQPSLWKQNTLTQIGNPKTMLRVDASLAAFIKNVRATLESAGYRPGDDVFGFFNLPGVIFAIGAKEPGAPWYFGTWYHDDDTDGGKLRRVGLKRRQEAWVITQADVTRFRGEFVQSGIDFPGGYRKIGQTVNPTTGLEIEIWKPLTRR